MLLLSRREQALCAFLLAMILVVSATGAWLTWRALKDQQVQLQGRSAAKTAVTDEHSLEADLSKRESAGLAKQAAPEATGRPGSSERSSRSSGATPSLQTSKPRTINGTVLAAVVSAVLLGAAAGAARLVLARFRRQQMQDAAAGGAERFFVDFVDFVDEVDEDVESGESALSQVGPPHQETEEFGHTRSEQLEPRDERLGSMPLLEVQSTAPSEAESLFGSPLIPAPRLSTWDARQEASLGGGSSPALDAPLLDESSSFVGSAHDVASENIFDRRAARRVPYVQSACLWWGDASGPVMVQDLSATGLRLRFPSPAPAQRPALGQSLRICFPLGGKEVEASGRVQWRRTVDGATEVGLQFLQLPVADQELIQAVIRAAA